MVRHLGTRRERMASESGFADYCRPRERSWYENDVLKKLGFALAVLLLGCVVFIAFRPAQFRVARSATIAAPAAIVYPLLSDFHAWDAWSPWSKLDPDMTRTFSGAARGKGAVYEWSGNDQVGKGRMEIVDTRENAQVTIDLHFITPFEASNTTVFSIADRPADLSKGGANAVDVTWAMSGRNGFVAKAFGLFMDVDALVGKDFEQGLANLKKVAEGSAAERSNP